ncbi:amino acid ABC transporter ATP-binding protein, PAAT family [Nocardioides terrae]|uniref:Amino acid ABC transporter ATP-binding protein, PAAT family n=1 Tax=Nocardioides terrae TaxID=574651 RepID=A0A1I1MPG1_9ACTN|nr:amino acid ABC transporter ATP-binding protein [Nocardioides terrae]SFC87279.1 amino acid ABC transporter ATP-binding protein, PAAT family [Nocardioides terrae]
MPSEDPLLEVAGLHKAYGDHVVLDGVDLSVDAGQVVALIGPSGSGKTTVLRSLNGLERPDGGTVRIGEVAVDFGARQDRAAEDRLRRQSAMVFQQHNLFPHLTVLQNVIEGPVRVQGRPRDEAVAEARALLDRVGLAAREDASPLRLSGGQQQRVGIVRALALRPRLLLFDEPTSALDPELVGEVLGVIKELAQQGWTMLIVTHELAFARDVADDVVFLDGGRIVERGPAGVVLREPREERTRQFVERLLRPF